MLSTVGEVWKLGKGGGDKEFDKANMLVLLKEVFCIQAKACNQN